MRSVKILDVIRSLILRPSNRTLDDVVGVRQDQNTGSIKVRFKDGKQGSLSEAEVSRECDRIEALHARHPFDFQGPFLSSTVNLAQGSSVELVRLPKELSIGQLELYEPPNQGQAATKIQLSVAQAREQLAPLLSKGPFVLPKLNPMTGEMEFFEVSTCEIMEDVRRDLGNGTFDEIAGAERTNLRSVIAFPTEVRQLRFNKNTNRFERYSGGFSCCVTITPQTNTCAVYDPKHGTYADFLDYNLNQSQRDAGNLFNMLGLMLEEAHLRHLRML